MEPPVPEWVIWIGAALGTIFAVLRVGLSGWKAPATSPAHAELTGALVDSSSVEQLAAAMEAVNVTLLTIHREHEVTSKARLEALRQMVAELKALSAVLRKSNDLTIQREEDQERRERESLKDENDRLRRELSASNKRQ